MLIQGVVSVALAVRRGSYTLCQSLVVLQTRRWQAGKVTVAGLLCCLLVHVEAHCIHCTSVKSFIDAQGICEELCIDTQQFVARTYR